MIVRDYFALSPTICKKSSIQIRNRKLENGREGDPKEVWDVGEGDPGDEEIYRKHRPDERGEDEKDINRGEVIILQSELEVGE